MNSRLSLLAVLLVAFALGLSGVGLDSDLFGWLFVASGVYHFVLAVLLSRGGRSWERLFAYSPRGQVLMGVSSVLFGALMLGVYVVPEGQRWWVTTAVIGVFYAGVRWELRERDRRQSGL